MLCFISSPTMMVCYSVFVFFTFQIHSINNWSIAVKSIDLEFALLLFVDVMI